MEQILITNENITECFDNINEHKYIGFDTETFGLAIDDQAFSFQFAVANASYYVNFLDYKDGTYAFEPYEFCRIFEGLWKDKSKVWFIHNAKFDLHKLLNYRVHISGSVHCTATIERVLYNQYQSYSLDACLRRRDRSKNSEVEDYIKQNKLWEWVTVTGKKKRDKKKYYDKVPFDIMFRYGCQDAEDVLFVGTDQINAIETDYGTHILNNEYKLQDTCLAMERIGVKVDRNYIARGIGYETKELEIAKKKATEMAGEEYRNGPKWLRAAFDKHGQSYKINEKTNNPIFDKYELENMESPIANQVKEIRRREKYLTSYYSSFEYFQKDSIVHANIRTAGTDTMRFSYSDPNLQNVPKEEDFEKGSVQVRKCFVPRPDHCFVMIDFDQQEFRLMLDYAGEIALIKRIMDHGEDVHQATADMMGVSRKEAKTLNFGLLYGMGIDKLAKQLKVSDAQASQLRKLYFARLPKVQRLIENIKRTASNRGFIRTWSGRKLYCPKRELAYKMPNHLIQGGCADIARFAMPELHNFLMYYTSNMIIQVHDEIVFEVHKDELDLVDNLQKIMENIYSPYNGMKLTCGVEHSWTSWGKQDVVDGYPTRDTLQELSH